MASKLVLNVFFVGMVATNAVRAEGGGVGRMPIRPSLQCTCVSDHRFELKCQASNVQERNFREQQSLNSCTPDAAADSQDWWLAEIPGYAVYRLSKRELAWQDAEEACEAHRGQLAALEGGERELKAILQAFSEVANNPKELFTVGIRYMESKEDFYTVRGQKMSNLPWRPDHPRLRKNQDCVTIAIEGKLHGPHSCNQKRRFFCKGSGMSQIA